MELFHGNDATPCVDYLYRDGSRYERRAFLKKEGGVEFIVAKEGDILEKLFGNHPFQWTVTREDIERGYLVAGSYEGVRAGTLEHPIFLTPRKEYRRGGPDRSSWSSW